MKRRKENAKQNMNRNAYLLISIGAVLVMILITMFGMLIFKMQIKNTVTTGEETVGKKYDKYYALITTDSDSSFWQSVFAGAREEADKNNAYVEILGDNLSVSYSEEEQMRIAIDSKVDGIIIEANESNRMKTLINEAVSAGIPVITALCDNTASVRQSYVGISSYNLGCEYGKQINKIASSYDKLSLGFTPESPLKVLVLINANADDSSQNIVFSGIQETVTGNNPYAERIRLETRAINTDGAFAAEESIRDIFMAHNNQPDVIICLDELNTTCVYQAVVDYNKVGQINIIGYYDSATILKAIERNVIYSTISVNTKQMGAYCVDALNEYIQSGYVSEYYAIDTNVITADNVKEYLGRE